MNRREYLKVSGTAFLSVIIAACRKDVGKAFYQKKLEFVGAFPLKVVSSDSFKIQWIAEHIKFISIYIKTSSNNWELLAENVDAKLGEYSVSLPSYFPVKEISVKITGEELESVKAGILTQNAFVIETSTHTELAGIGGVKEITLEGKSAFVKRSSSTGIKCFSSACTHSGCPISFWQNQNKFNCSCHGSQFDSDGNVTQGPAQLPLDTYVCETLGSEKFRIFY